MRVVEDGPGGKCLHHNGGRGEQKRPLFSSTWRRVRQATVHGEGGPGGGRLPGYEEEDRVGHVGAGHARLEKIAVAVVLTWFLMRSTIRVISSALTELRAAT